jgi:hypothetical protein
MKVFFLLFVIQAAIHSKLVNGDLYSTNYDDDDDDVDVDNNDNREDDEFDGLEVNVDGTVVDKNPSSVVTVFTNSYTNLAISLHWVGQDEDVVIAEIEPYAPATINTFVGHSFYATTIEDSPQRAAPKTVTIREHVTEYKFGPPVAPVSVTLLYAVIWRLIWMCFQTEHSIGNGSLHPSVKLLNKRSTSVNVKFRSLAPAIDMWYDGGGSETFQGSLSMVQSLHLMLRFLPLLFRAKRVPSIHMKDTYSSSPRRVTRSVRSLVTRCLLTTF